MRKFVITAALCLIGLTAQARDIFVNNVVGDDRRGGTLPLPVGESGGPCRTIAKALRIAEASDRIVIADTGEPYREGITLQAARHSGTDRFPFVIVGNGATLDGTISLAGADWDHVAAHTFRTRPPHMSFQQLFLNGQPAVRRAPEQRLQLKPLEWSLADGWLYFCTEQDRLPVAYDLACCGEQVGITLYDVHDVIVQDLNLRGFWLDGVNCHDNVRRTDLVRLSATDNGRSGFSVGGASRVRIDTCTAAGNGAAQVRAEGYAIVELVDTRLDPASAPAVVREGGRIVEPPAE
jgi:hypothetical protein